MSKTYREFYEMLEKAPYDFDVEINGSNIKFVPSDGQDDYEFPSVSIGNGCEVAILGNHQYVSEELNDIAELIDSEDPDFDGFKRFVENGYKDDVPDKLEDENRVSSFNENQNLFLKCLKQELPEKTIESILSKLWLAGELDEGNETPIYKAYSELTFKEVDLVVMEALRDELVSLMH